MPSRPSRAMRPQWGHSGLSRRSTQAASGSSSANPATQRSRLKVMGGISPTISRPTTALPAHSRGGRVSSRAVRAVRRWVMGLGGKVEGHCTRLAACCAARAYPLTHW